MDDITTHDPLARLTSSHFSSFKPTLHLPLQFPTPPDARLSGPLSAASSDAVDHGGAGAGAGAGRSPTRVQSTTSPKSSASPVNRSSSPADARIHYDVDISPLTPPSIYLTKPLPAPPSPSPTSPPSSTRSPTTRHRPEPQSRTSDSRVSVIQDGRAASPPAPPSTLDRPRLEPAPSADLDRPSSGGGARASDISTFTHYWGCLYTDVIADASPVSSADDPTTPAHLRNPATATARMTHPLSSSRPLPLSQGEMATVYSEAKRVTDILARQIQYLEAKWHENDQVIDRINRQLDELNVNVLDKEFPMATWRARNKRPPQEDRPPENAAPAGKVDQRRRGSTRAFAKAEPPSEPTRPNLRHLEDRIHTIQEGVHHLDERAHELEDEILRWQVYLQEADDRNGRLAEAVGAGEQAEAVRERLVVAFDDVERELTKSEVFRKSIPVRGSVDDGRLGTGRSSPDDDDNDDDHSDPSSSPGSGAYHRPPSIDREDLVARVKDLESRLKHQTTDIGLYKLDVKGYKKDVRERDKEIAQQRATIEKQEAIIRELQHHRFRSQHQLLPPPASPITLDPNEDQVLLSHVPLGIDLGGAPMMVRPPGSLSRPTRSIPPSVPVAVSAEAGEASTRQGLLPPIKPVQNLNSWTSTSSSASVISSPLTPPPPPPPRPLGEVSKWPGRLRTQSLSRTRTRWSDATREEVSGAKRLSKINEDQHGDDGEVHEGESTAQAGSGPDKKQPVEIGDESDRKQPVEFGDESNKKKGVEDGERDKKKEKKKKSSLGITKALKKIIEVPGRDELDMKPREPSTPPPPPVPAKPKGYLSPAAIASKHSSTNPSPRILLSPSLSLSSPDRIRLTTASDGGPTQENRLGSNRSSASNYDSPVVIDSDLEITQPSSIDQGGRRWMESLIFEGPYHRHHDLHPGEPCNHNVDGGDYGN